MSDSFGYLTQKGFSSGGKTVRWPVLIGEFSAPHAGAPGDYATMDGFVDCECVGRVTQACQS
jgi:hypothetical protein